MAASYLFSARDIQMEIELQSMTPDVGILNAMGWKACTSFYTTSYRGEGTPHDI